MVRGTADTILTLGNTTYDGKSLKQRFREGKNGRPLLELNLCPSGRDALGSSDYREQRWRAHPARLRYLLHRAGASSE